MTSWGTSRLIKRQAKVCRHWWGVRCTGQPCSSRTSQVANHELSMFR